MIETIGAGLVTGGAYATLALAIVMMYRMIGVLNFALAAVGSVGLFVALWVNDTTAAPYAVSALVGAVVAAAVGAVMGLVDARWLSQLGVVIRSSATIGMMIGLIAISLQVFGNSVRNAPSLVPGTVALGDFRLPYTAVVSAAAAVVLAIVVSLFLARTRTGIRLRAIAARPITANLVGVPVRRLIVITWAGTGFLAAIAVTLLAPAFPSSFTDLSFLIAPALAAALLGGLVSVVWGVVGGLAVGVLQAFMLRGGWIADLQDVLPFVLIVLILGWTKRREVWNDAR
ncbi:branched-chain amino acid ABC transporter permease [Microbacterium sp. SORGH_AS_0888]|uniref:branched-chain amino acid ABC transporter permease n=1 Tax=Microbacterium sp. SORGH_AS_0888 TaxID=3041791 RepID=UPI002781CE64|nr:branched-chain amino acid ABC transporter permease [Microbacterium sp. SORGH_AS_0888]MDQ1131005.1 branched-chain amino acid transport system permease protein [Microbacterium sp. SORGH_AS_0888]